MVWTKSDPHGMDPCCRPSCYGKVRSQSCGPSQIPMAWKSQIPMLWTLMLCKSLIPKLWTKSDPHGMENSDTHVVDQDRLPYYGKDRYPSCGPSQIPMVQIPMIRLNTLLLFRGSWFIKQYIWSKGVK